MCKIDHFFYQDLRRYFDIFDFMYTYYKYGIYIYQVWARPHFNNSELSMFLNLIWSNNWCHNHLVDKSFIFYHLYHINVIFLNYCFQIKEKWGGLKLIRLLHCRWQPTLSVHLIKFIYLSILEAWDWTTYLTLQTSRAKICDFSERKKQLLSRSDQIDLSKCRVNTSRPD